MSSIFIIALVLVASGAGAIEWIHTYQSNMVSFGSKYPCVGSFRSIYKD